jgi:hypothetical protein
MTAALAVAAVLGCTDSTDLTGAGSPVPIALAPHFQLLPVDLPWSPIDRIRIRAVDVSTSQTVGSTDVAVSPLADEWRLDLAVDLRGAPWMTLRVETELLSGQSVEWSGRTEGFMVRPGRGDPQPVEIFRGPLDNLDAVALEIENDPLRVVMGSALDLSAAVTLKEGSTANPVVYWGTDTAFVGLLTTTEGRTSFLGVLPGTATVYAGAGVAIDTVTVEVVPVASQINISVGGLLLDGLGLTTQLTAQVIDGLGNVNPDAEVTWSTADGSVLGVDATGLVTALGFGSGLVRASSGDVTDSTSLNVLGPDLILSTLDIVPNLDNLISLLSQTGFQMGIQNAGAAAAPATAVQVRVLDGATDEDVLPALTFQVPTLAPGGSLSLDVLGGEQVLSLGTLHLPASLRFEVVVDPDDQVAELDETNNSVGTDLFSVSPLAPLGFDVEWLGLTSIWEDAANWTTGIVPGLNDLVFVPLTEILPTITSVVGIAGLTLADGASLTLDGGLLSVAGDLVGAGGILGSGTRCTACRNNSNVTKRRRRIGSCKSS